MEIDFDWLVSLFDEVTFASNALFLHSTSPEKASGIETAKDEVANDEKTEGLLRDFKKKVRSSNGNDKYEEKRKGLD